MMDDKWEAWARRVAREPEKAYREAVDFGRRELAEDIRDATALAETVNVERLHTWLAQQANCRTLRAAPLHKDS